MPQKKKPRATAGRVEEKEQKQAPVTHAPQEDVADPVTKAIAGIHTKTAQKTAQMRAEETTIHRVWDPIENDAAAMNATVASYLKDSDMRKALVQVFDNPKGTLTSSRVPHTEDTRKVVIKIINALADVGVTAECARMNPDQLAKKNLIPEDLNLGTDIVKLEAAYNLVPDKTGHVKPGKTR